MSVKLNYDDRDIGKIFAKVSWRTSNDARKAGTKFSWDPQGRYYAYCNIINDEIVFKTPSREASIRMGRKTSKVGDAVLASELKQLDFTHKTISAASLANHIHGSVGLSTCDVNIGVDAQMFDVKTSVTATSIRDDNMDLQGMLYESINRAFDYLKITNDVSVEKEVDAAYSVLINQINQNQKKGINMKETKMTPMQKELLELLTPKEVEVEPKTAFEARKPFSVEVYGVNGDLIEVNHYEKKKEAKAYLQNPAHIGRKVVLKEEIAVYTTNVPVVEVK